MRKLHLALAIHNHQPVGNFDWVFENAVRLAYEPMIAALECHPGVRLALHYSGPLRDWLAANCPGLLKRLRALVRRGQLEMMTGGYYEPVFAALPDADKLGQVKKMTAAVKRDFDYQASGAWLAERAWEPHLPKPLAEAGVQYTIVDDTHFKYVGLSDDDLLGYYVTEEQGYPLKVFGSSRYLRFATPWRPVAEVIDWLRGQADESGARVAVMGDDGEKFGLWPGTHEHCWERCWDAAHGWIEELFAALEANADWLITTPPGEYAAAYPAIGRVYLPTAAYEEMAVWSLPAEASADLATLRRRLQAEGREDILRFMKGGFWRSFMARYPEINTMHKKMLHVSSKVHRIKRRAIRNQALDALWAGQCNCPYWHGVFGGIYLLHIREATYERLIAAEALADAEAHTQASWVDAQLVDMDADGHADVILSSDAQCLTFAPASGGALVEWDWRKLGLNLVNTMTRRPEGYHRDLRQAAQRGELVLTSQSELLALHAGKVRVKEAGLDQKLFYDWYRRASLLDHFLSPGETLEAFSRCQHAEWGDFVDQPYEAALPDAQPADSLSLKLVRQGNVRTASGAGLCPLRLEKTIRLQAGQLTLAVAYRLANLGERPISARFGVETNWGWSGGDGPQAYSVWPGGELVRLNVAHALSGASEAGLVNEWFGRVVVNCTQPADWWQFPIETISNSEAGFERVFQTTSVLTHWPLELAPGQAWETTLRFKLV